MMRYSIYQDVRTRKVAFITALGLIILGIALGLWQLRRGEYKEYLAFEISQKEKLAPYFVSEKIWPTKEVLYHPMVASGRWLSSEGVWLDNRPHPLGRDPKSGISTGFYLIMPLIFNMNGQNHLVWVNRGWAPRSFTQRDLVPEVTTSENLVEVRGVAFADAGKTFAMASSVSSEGSTPAGEVRVTAVASDNRPLIQNFSIEETSKKLNLPYQPFLLRQVGPDDSNLLDRQWQLPDSGASKHRAYAVQWFALALMTFLFWIITGIRKQSERLR